MSPPGTMPSGAHGATPNALPRAAAREGDNPLSFSIRVSAYRSARDAMPRTVACDYPSFVRALTTFRPAGDITDKRMLAAWSPAVIQPGKRRANDNVESVSAIVLDYDDGTTPDDARGPWADWPSIIHSSWSNETDVPKFRLIIPLGRPVPAAAWRWVWAWASARAVGSIDRACKDASRMYFLPHKRPGKPMFAESSDPGGWLCDPDWDRVGMEALAAAGRSPAAQSAAAQSAGARRLVPWASAERAAREALRNDPAARARWAVALGARITSDRAYGIRCPSCGRASVWFALSPHSWAGAACNHRNSCGWAGFLDQLESP